MPSPSASNVAYSCQSACALVPRCLPTCCAGGTRLQASRGHASGVHRYPVPARALVRRLGSSTAAGGMPSICTSLVAGCTRVFTVDCASPGMAPCWDLSLMLLCHAVPMPCRSPTSRKGMPQELEEKYYGKEEFTFINVRGAPLCCTQPPSCTPSCTGLQRCVACAAAACPPICSAASCKPTAFAHSSPPDRRCRLSLCSRPRCFRRPASAPSTNAKSRLRHEHWRMRPAADAQPGLQPHWAAITPRMPPKRTNECKTTDELCSLHAS